MEQQDAQIDKKPFKGYTIDELRYHRAMTLARCEVAKTHAMDSLSAVGGSIVNDQTAKRNVFGRIVQGIDYVDYTVMGYRVWKKISKILQHRHREKE